MVGETSANLRSSRNSDCEKVKCLTGGYFVRCTVVLMVAVVAIAMVSIVAFAEGVEEQDQQFIGQWQYRYKEVVFELTLFWNGAYELKEQGTVVRRGEWEGDVTLFSVEGEVMFNPGLYTKGGTKYLLEFQGVDNVCVREIVDINQTPLAVLAALEAPCKIVYRKP